MWLSDLLSESSETRPTSEAENISSGGNEAEGTAQHLAEALTPSTLELAYARSLLVNCPSTGGKLHCWHCSRCDRARKCAAWLPQRPNVIFFKRSEEPYSLFLVEEVPGVLQ
jgi:hypothetical protein